ncbi:OmpA family protein [Loktanella sp. M215]|uniref:OmpA family protein n=1 Tax=Loktanella sp. M215 TaxID=2675431 RepID=UPI001F16894E|nr:OmpA family protein [Loktanella sp. M215]MCF7699909.1 OmpA family protein [Loktanella sp. M215]
MLQRLVPIVAVAALSAGLLVSPLNLHAVAAQAADAGGETAEQMAEKFRTQKTRGLVLATPDAAASDAATDAAPQGADTVAEIATAIPQREQVNVNVSFDFDSAALRADQKPKLVTLCGALKAADVQAIRILGHTDASGTADYNERLSKLRAEEVKRFLATDCGFPEDRMEALGVGERFPFDPANPKADANRRVEFQALS